MSSSVITRLRERLGFTPHEVAAAGGWSRRAYAELERSDDPGVEDAMKLGDLFGVDLMAVLESGKVRSREVQLAALLKGNADILTADTRFALTEAMSVARDVRQLEEALGRRPRLKITSFREDKNLRPDSVRDLVQDTRKRLDISGPISNIISDCFEPLGILLFSVPFSDSAVEALSCWTERTGAVVLVNQDGKHASGVHTLRAALAHELCHLLFDRHKMRDFNKFCELERTHHNASFEEQESIERRARAFSVEVIAPREEVRAAWESFGRPDGRDGIVRLANHFGLGAIAMRHQLEYATNQTFDGRAGLTSRLDPSLWPEVAASKLRDTPASVPPMRRGRLLDLVKQGSQSGALSSSWARELLRVDIVDWERISASWH